MWTASSAISTCRASRSASENTATVLILIRRAVLTMRQAISPRLAISSFPNMAPRRRPGLRLGATPTVKALGGVREARRLRGGALSPGEAFEAAVARRALAGDPLLGGAQRER